MTKPPEKNSNRTIPIEKKPKLRHDTNSDLISKVCSIAVDELLKYQVMCVIKVDILEKNNDNILYSHGANQQYTFPSDRAYNLLIMLATFHFAQNNNIDITSLINISDSDFKNDISYKKGYINKYQFRQLSIISLIFHMIVNNDYLARNILIKFIGSSYVDNYIGMIGLTKSYNKYILPPINETIPDVNNDKSANNYHRKRKSSVDDLVKKLKQLDESKSNMQNNKSVKNKTFINEPIMQFWTCPNELNKLLYMILTRSPELKLAKKYIETGIMILSKTKRNKITTQMDKLNIKYLLMGISESGSNDSRLLDFSQQNNRKIKDIIQLVGVNDFGIVETNKYKFIISIMISNIHSDHEYVENIAGLIVSHIVQFVK
jgi:hypothetical protein